MVNKSLLTAVSLGAVFLGISSISLQTLPSPKYQSRPLSQTQPYSQPSGDNCFPISPNPDDRIAKEERIRNLEARGYYFHRQ